MNRETNLINEEAIWEWLTGRSSLEQAGGSAGVFEWLTGRGMGEQAESAEWLAEADDGPAALPASIHREWARPVRRVHHFLWHYFRDGGEWSRLPEHIRRRAERSAWRPPRFTGQPGAGIDFLGMHRLMVQETRRLLPARLHHLAAGWNPIPWNHRDPVWPMPAWPSPPPSFKQSSETSLWQRAAQSRYERDSWLRTVTLDALGTEMERGIHGWMHMHWSAPEPPESRILADDVSADWLGHPYSSQVNSHFWKLHGWIDDRISQWERANGRTANLSTAWSGPFPRTATRTVRRSGETVATVHAHPDEDPMFTLFRLLDRERVLAWRFPMELAATALERLNLTGPQLVA